MPERGGGGRGSGPATAARRPPAPADPPSSPKEAADPAPGSGAQSVERALSLLSLVAGAGAGGATLAAVVRASGLNKPTVRRQLIALIRAGMIEQDAARRYHLGQAVYVLGTLAARRHGLLEMAAESLRRIAEDCGDTAFVSARHGDWALCLHRQEGGHPVRTHALQTGNQNPLGVGAGSLAMLAALPEAEREAILRRIGPALADYPGYGPEVIRADIAATRAAGYALNPGRVHPSSWGIGVALRFPDGGLAGALSIAAVDSRMREDRQRELAALLHREAAVVEDRMRRMFGPVAAAGGE